MELIDAKNRANSIRFSGELTQRNADQIYSGTSAKDLLLISTLEITEEITPSLNTILNDVCSSLEINRSLICAFIINDPAYQATLHAGAEEECVISISSGLVKALEADELAFVLGHEIGHYLLDHTGIMENDLAPESFMHNRAQEISADRIGLLASGRIEAAIGTFIKTLSGLRADHLRINIANFISQASKIETPDEVQNEKSTHPPILIRSRALVHFLSAFQGELSISKIDRSAMLQADQRILLDLKRFIDAPIHKQEEQIKKDLILSMAVSHIVLNSNEIERNLDLFEELFGTPSTASLRVFINSYDQEERSRICQKNLERDRSRLERLFPHSFVSIYKNMQSKISDHFE